MTPAPMTGRQLFHALRRAGVGLGARGDRLSFDAPAGAMTPELRGRMTAAKRELLAVVRGDYPLAALALILAHPDPGRRATLADWFDQRVAVHECGDAMSRGQATRSAYIDLARMVELGGRGAVPCSGAERAREIDQVISEADQRGPTPQVDL